MSIRAQVFVWTLQRISAAILGICVLVHLVTIIYAVRSGLTGAEILGRTTGSVAWATFYGVFVVATAIHAPIGLRNVAVEHTAWRGRSLDIALTIVMLWILVAGFRAVFAVFGPA